MLIASFITKRLSRYELISVQEMYLIWCPYPDVISAVISYSVCKNGGVKGGFGVLGL